MNNALTLTDSSLCSLHTITTPQIAGFLLKLSCPPNHEKLLWKIKAAAKKIPRFQNILTADPYPILKQDLTFNSANHLSWIQLEGNVTFDDVVKHSSLELMKGLPQNKPPWKIVVISTNSSHLTGLLVMAHHVLTDGIGGLRLLTLLSSLGENKPINQHKEKKFYSIKKNFSLRNNSSKIKTTLALLKLLFASFTTKNYPSIFNGINSDQRKLIVLSLELHSLTQLALQKKVKMNDLIIALLVDALSKISEEKSPLNSSIRMLLPFNIRPLRERSTGGNQIVSLALNTTLKPKDPLERIQEIAGKIDEIKTSGTVEAYKIIENVCFFIEKNFKSGLIAKLSAKTNFVCTYYPWYHKKISIADAVVDQLYPITPLLPSQGISFTFVKYAKHLDVSLMIDPTIISDPQLITEAIISSHKKFTAFQYV